MEDIEPERTRDKSVCHQRFILYVIAQQNL
jgi:hypothetical protein